jgi:hypothetical protein
MEEISSLFEKTMTVPYHKFGNTTLAKVKNSMDLRHVLIDTWLGSETIIIKPNWGSTDPGDFSDVETLRL